MGQKRHPTPEAGSSIAEVIAYPLFVAKPLPEPMLNYSQSDPQKQITKNRVVTALHVHKKQYLYH